MRENTFDITLDQSKITIRPLTSEDVALEQQLLENLSPENKYYRFLGGVDHLSQTQLKKLCDIDFEHRMAFIATRAQGSGTVALGISRYATDENSRNCEFTLTIADAWLTKGLSQILMQTLIDYAKQHRIAKLYAIESAYNQPMAQLARTFGMHTETDPNDAHQVIYSLVMEQAVAS